MGGDAVNGSADCAVVADTFSERTDAQSWLGMGRSIDAHSFVVRTRMPTEEYSGQLGSKTSVYFLDYRNSKRKQTWNLKGKHNRPRVQIEHTQSKETSWCDTGTRTGCAFDALLFKSVNKRRLWRNASLPVGMMKLDAMRAILRLYNLRFNITAAHKASKTIPANTFSAFLATALVCEVVTGYGIAGQAATGQTGNERRLMLELGSGETAGLGREIPSDFAEGARRCLVAKSGAGCIRAAA